MGHLKSVPCLLPHWSGVRADGGVGTLQLWAGSMYTYIGYWILTLVVQFFLAGVSASSFCDCCRHGAWDEPPSPRTHMPVSAQQAFSCLTVVGGHAGGDAVPAHGLLQHLRECRRISLCSQVQTTSPNTGDGLSYLSISSLESGGSLGISTRWTWVNCAWCALSPSNFGVLHR